MAKIVLEDTNGGYNIASINRNFQKIASELNNKVLYRLNDIPFESNAWLSNMDANGKRLYNLPTPVLPNEAARLQDVRNAISGLVPANFVPFTPYRNITADNVQGAVQQVEDEVIDLSQSLEMGSYAELRNYTGVRKAIYLTGLSETPAHSRRSGYFIRDSADVSSLDNGGTVIVTALGVRYKRSFTEAVDVQWFGARADDFLGAGSDSYLAIQAAINYAVSAKIGEVKAEGFFRISDTLVMNTNVYTQGISLRGIGNTTRIRQSGTGKDAVWFSTTQFLQNCGIYDLDIACDVSAGHCINIVYGCTTCFVRNTNLSVANPNKSCVYGDYTSFGGGIYDTKFSGGSWYLSPTSVAGGFVIRANGTIFNENVFDNLRVYNAYTKQFFDIRTVVQPEIWLTNNTWKNINIEVCRGGGFIVDSLKNCTFQNISFWDTSGPYVNNLIDMVAGTGYESAANTFIGISRNGDSLSPSVRDVRIISGQDTLFVNCYTAAGVGPSYDFSNKRVTVIGRMINVENRNNTQLILPEQISVTAVVADNIAGGTLSIGGRGSPETVAMTYAGGFFQITPIPVSSSLIFTSTTAGGTQSKLIFSPDGIYPLTDNFVSLGAAGQRWTQVYAAAGTINTSDENSKDIRQEGIDPAVLRAWGKVEFYQYKFRDAVALKGDAARWHFGVVAQRVKEAFESEGLDAFAYGLLCYDEWDGKDAVLDEKGIEIVPQTFTGSRYGIRYEEALTLECAYLRSRLPV